MPESSNRDFVQSLYDIFGRGDIPGLIAALPEDIRWSVHGPAGMSPFFGDWHGRSGVKQFFQTVAEHVKYDKFLIREMVTQGDTVVVLGRDSGSSRGTGKRYESDFVHVWT